MITEPWKYSTSSEPGMYHIVDTSNSILTAMGLSRLNLSTGNSYSAVFPEEESCFYIVSGTVQLSCAGRETLLKEGDLFYLPLNTHAEMTAGEQDAVMVIPRAPAEEKRSFFVTRFEDVWRSSDDHEFHGSFGNSREILMYAGTQRNTSKLLVGVTVGQDGAWTAWPPHEHAETFEEIYFYFGMAGFGVHLELTDDGRELAEIVRNNDVVIVPKGYHPLVASPGTRLKYIFMMAAKRSDVDPGSYKEMSNVHPALKDQIMK